MASTRTADSRTTLATAKTAKAAKAGPKEEALAFEESPHWWAYQRIGLNGKAFRRKGRTVRAWS